MIRASWLRSTEVRRIGRWTVLSRNILPVATWNAVSKQTRMEENFFSPQKIRETSEAFATSHNVKFDGPFEDDRLGVFLLYQLMTDVQNTLSDKAQVLMDAKEPTWAMLYSMLNRVFEHCEGSFLTFITGAWATTEVAVRAVMEAAVTLMYITTKERQKRLLQYLTYFWENERKLNQKRLSMADRLTPELQSAHKKAAIYNIGTNETREKLINQILQEAGFPTTTEPGWPSAIYDRFSALNLESDYRTIYSHLSSEVHNDANSLVDYMIYKALGEKFTQEAATQEIYLRVRLYLYYSLKYCIDAACYFISSYDLDAIYESSMASQTVELIFADISYELIKLRSPQNIRDQIKQNPKRQVRNKHHRKQS